MRADIASLLAKSKLESAELAQLLTYVEKQGAQSLRHEELLNPRGCAFRLGVTGPPGAGKSTLIGCWIQKFREQGLKVGVIAVDPSSPFSHGAILGDRIRYSEYFDDPDVFIRSVGSRGSLGGLSASTHLMVRAFDHAEFDVVLIETVGVGQSELEIMFVADFVSVVLVPESGDSVQAMKAGLLEIADQFIVNKSDRPGSESLKRELESSVLLGKTLGHDKDISVFSVSALRKEGLNDVMTEYLKQRDQKEFRHHRHQAGRLRQEARSLGLADLVQKTEKYIHQINDLEGLQKYFFPES